MNRYLGLLCAVALATSPALTTAKPAKKPAGKVTKKTGPTKMTEQTKKAMSDLAGKYKWGMTHEQVMEVIATDIKAAYAEKLKKVSSPLEQDKLRDEMNIEITKLRDSYIEFNGQKTSWDISVVDQEFAHRTNESMFIYWEANQRRFFFFDNDHLWKQFIALNAELFEGKTFEQFAEMIAARYGAPQKVTAVDSRGKESLDHLEWPPSGDFFLKAIDQVAMYGSYCLVLSQKSVMDAMEKRRKDAAPAHGGKSGADQVFSSTPDKGGDGNADVIDQITGKQSAKPRIDTDNEQKSGLVIGTGSGASSDDSAPAEPKAKPKKGKKGKKK